MMKTPILLSEEWDVAGYSFFFPLEWPTFLRIIFDQEWFRETVVISFSYAKFFVV